MATGDMPKHKRGHEYESNEHRGQAGQQPEPGHPRDELTIACLLIPYFPLRVEILRHPELDGAPVVLIDATSRRREVTACSAEAAARGVREGMSLRDVIAIDPAIVILNADPVAYRRTFSSLVDRLRRYSPGVEVGAGDLGCIYIDLRGLRRQAGGIDALSRRLLQAAPPLLRPHLGMATTKFTARVAAQHARPGQVYSMPPEYARAFLAPHSIDLLPVSHEMKRELRQLGLTHLRDLARRPPGKLQARFGPEGRRAWELANGEDREPLIPEPESEQITERLVLPAPAVQIDLVLLGVEQAVVHLFRHPALSGRGIRGLRLQLVLEGQQSWEQIIAFKGVIALPSHLAGLIADRLRTAQLAGPVVEIILEATGLSSEIARQGVLPMARARRARRLAAAIRELTQRYGVSPIYRVVEVEPWSRIPERRHALMSFDPSISLSR